MPAKTCKQVIPIYGFGVVWLVLSSMRGFFGRPPNLPIALNCSALSFFARALPPIRANSVTLSFFISLRIPRGATCKPMSHASSKPNYPSRKISESSKPQSSIPPKWQAHTERDRGARLVAAGRGLPLQNAARRQRGRITRRRRRTIGRLGCPIARTRVFVISPRCGAAGNDPDAKPVCGTPRAERSAAAVVSFH